MDCHPIRSEPRVSCTLHEFPSYPSLHLRVDRPSLESSVTHIIPSEVQVRTSGQSHPPVPFSAPEHPQSSGEGPRFPSVCLDNGPDAQGPFKGRGKGLETQSKLPSPRQEVSPSPHSQKRLRPWTTAMNLSRSIHLLPPPTSLITHTDASLSGWGGHSPSRDVKGTWSPAFQHFHFNSLEAMAVFLTLKRLRPKRKIHFRLVLDSAVAVSCLNRRGSKTPCINHVMVAIFSLAEKHSWHLSATHLEGVRNVVADSLSRT